MGRAPCCDKANVKKGPWSPEEDEKLKDYIEKHGTGGNWIALPQKAGLKRCGKSCRLRWLNYLRPNIKHGDFSDDEDRIICSLYANIGSRWSIIAAQLPGRTDNDIKNYWNTKLKKKLMGMMMIPNNNNNNNLCPRKLPHHQLASSSTNYKYNFSSLLQTNNSSLPSSPSTVLSSSSSPYKPNCHPFSTTLTNNNNNSFSTLLQFQENFVGPIQTYTPNQMKDSCSSSDGSLSNKIDYEYGGAGGADQMGFQSYYYNGAEQQSQIGGGGGGGGSGWCEIKQNGLLWGDNSVTDYGLEEIKQLISSSSSGSRSCCNNFLFEENKTEEKVMYY